MNRDPGSMARICCLTVSRGGGGEGWCGRFSAANRAQLAEVPNGRIEPSSSSSAVQSSADARWGEFSRDKELGSGREIELAGGVEGREPEIGPAGADSTWLEIEPASETLGRLLEKSILFVQEKW